MQVAFAYLAPAGNSFEERTRRNDMQAAILTKQIDLDAIKTKIAERMDAACFSAWISPLTIKISDNQLVFAAPNQFTADYVGATYSNILNDVAAEYGLNATVYVENMHSVRRENANDNNTQTYTAPMAEKSDDNFDAFIASEENAFILSACKKVASKAATFSPLFIYGPAGCGKTLLANSINAAAHGRTVMMSGAAFVSEFARALQNKTIFAFKDYCRNVDTFILDDVQVLAGKRATCEEFLQLLVDLRGAGKQIILTANAAPSNLTSFDHRAQSLFASGLVADVAAPNRAVRCEMFRRAGVDAGLADTLAGRVMSNGHIISGIVTKIKAYGEIMGEKINAAIAEKILSDSLQKSKSPILIVKSMCEKLGVSYDAVCGNGRARALVLARQMMMVVLKNVTTLSLSEIGSYVGGRDHATVMYGIDRIEKIQGSDLVMASQIAQMIEEYK